MQSVAMQNPLISFAVLERVEYDPVESLPFYSEYQDRNLINSK